MTVNKQKKGIAKILLCIFVVALLSVTAFAVNDGAYFAFTIANGSQNTVNMKNRGELWYPLEGSATWDLSVDSSSRADVAASLYYVKAYASDKYVNTLSIGPGESDCCSLAATGKNAYYATFRPSNTGGATGETGMQWPID